MKILVDVLPCFGTDCLLFKRGTCAISGGDCVFLERVIAVCPYLKVIESEETK